MQLCSIDKVKTLLEMHGTGMEDTNKYDDMLMMIIDWVSGRIQDYCGRQFEYGAKLEYLDGDGRRDFIYVDCPPIDSTVTVEIWDDIDRVYADANKLTAAQIVVYPIRGRIKYETGPFGVGNRNVKVSYTGGYKQSEIPDSLAGTAVEQCAFVFRNRKRLGIVSQTDDTGSITRTVPAFELLNSVKAALNRSYTKIRF